MVFPLEDKLQVGADELEQLHCRRCAVGGHHEAVARAGCGNLAQHRRVELTLDFGAGLRLATQQLAGVKEDDRQNQPYDERDGQQLNLAYGDRLGGDKRRVDHDTFRHRVGQHDGCLLALLKQQQVKRLLDFLVTLEVYNLTFLARQAAERRLGLTHLGAQLLDHGQGVVVVLGQRHGDVAAHGVKLLLEVLHLEVLLLGPAHKLQSLDSHVIVSVDEGIHSGSRLIGGREGNHGVLIVG